MGDPVYTIRWIGRYPVHATMTFEGQIEQGIEAWTQSGWRVVCVAFQNVDTLMVVLVK